MYPKELVYPRGGGEFSLEMIRAGMEVYQVPAEDGNDSGMDFTCMPGDLIHNTKNLPVYKSQGNVGHHGQQAQVCSSCMHSCTDGIRTMPNTIYHYKCHLVFCHFCCTVGISHQGLCTQAFLPQQTAAVTASGEGSPRTCAA